MWANDAGRGLAGFGIRLPAGKQPRRNRRGAEVSPGNIGHDGASRGGQRAAAGKDHSPEPSRARPLLKQRVLQVLKTAGKPLPAALRDRVLKVGYPARNPKTVYTQLFALGEKDSGIVKTKEGFALR
jgi:hypothetical protein